jgi:hypothetical protein
MIYILPLILIGLIISIINSRKVSKEVEYFNLNGYRYTKYSDNTYFKDSDDPFDSHEINEVEYNNAKEEWKIK